MQSKIFVEDETVIVSKNTALDEKHISSLSQSSLQQPQQQQPSHHQHHHKHKKHHHEQSNASSQGSSVLQLLVCVVGIYSSFLIWAICQEKVSTTEYPRRDGTGSDRFKNVLFMNTIQSAMCVVSATGYIYYLASPEARKSWWSLLGLPDNQAAKKSILSGYSLISLLSTLSSPFGFLALSHISFLTLLLGKSCKLIPVMLVQVLIYRKKLPLSKYVIVILVTLGIYIFMAYDARTQKKKTASAGQASSLFGLGLLGINLFLDGLVNSTQDRIIERYKIKGHHMMFFMNFISTIYTAIALLAPTSLLPGTWAKSANLSTDHTNGFMAAYQFLYNHPTCLKDLFLFAFTGAVGQIFIFRTLALYGSLTLVTITVTRKMMTMILSVFLFNHSLEKSQWVGVGIVFAGILLEAELKRRKTKSLRK